MNVFYYNDMEEVADLNLLIGRTTLSSVRTRQAAESYVDSVLKQLVFSDVKECVALATGIKTKKLITRKTRRPRSSRASGGFYTGGIRENTELMTEFLAIMDSVHDFGRGAPADSGSSLESLTEVFGIMGRPESYFDPAIRHAVRTGVSDKFERELLRFLTTEDFLVLGGKLILNTLRRCNLLKVNQTLDNRTGQAQYRQQQKFNKTDENFKIYEIWSFKQQSSIRNIIEFKQLLELHQKLTALCGSRSMVLDTFTDTDDEIMRYATAADMIHQVTMERFELKGQELAICLPNVQLDEMGKLQRLLDKAAQLRQRVRVASNRFITCDANLYDSARTAASVFVDTRATGSIPQCESFSLQGVVGSPQQLCLKILNVDVTIDPSLVNRVSSKQSVFDLLDEDLTSETGVSSVTVGRPAALKRLHPVLTALSKRDRLGLKRAGDWGQVEYCKRRDHVFVTRDRLAALYAYHRKTRFIFYRNLQEMAGFRHVFVCYQP